MGGEQVVARGTFGGAEAARRGRCGLAPFAALVTLITAAVWAGPTQALPSFAQQTGQPCAQCHVGAFGPQLKPYGRDFKLFGYVSNDGKSTLPPIAAVATASYTRTEHDRTPVPGYNANDNWAFQSLILAYAGQVAGGVGAFAETVYDGVHDNWTIGNVDIRRAFNPTVGGKDVVLGLDLNDKPTVQDLWNSTPAFEFNTASSAFGVSPQVGPLVDGKLGGRAVGVGAYGLYDEFLYGEFTAYSPLSNGFVGQRLGLNTPPTADVYSGVAPYWRVALQHSFHDRHYFEIGAYGLQASRFPGGSQQGGEDTLNDAALDATYQYIGGKKSFVTAHATLIHEDDDLTASHIILHSRPVDHLDVARADVVWSYDDTWTPAAEVFETTGSTDKPFFKTPTGSPDSRGYVVELSYTPWGKSRSVVWANTRFTVRFVGYTEFNGRAAGASANDTLYFSTRVALAPLGALAGH
ncbi:MAG TPA: hypothetical protein VGG29_08640 [Caulobacteraceae bacterium]|jgi:hypothetical protein